MENMGTGINKIRKLCKDQNLSLPEFGYDNFFTITFKREGVSNEGLNNRHKLIIRAITDNPGINAKNLSETIQIPVSTLERDLKHLIERKIIERKGSKKTGGYVSL
jgi:ATP-dependent DNA helicase RecG